MPALPTVAEIQNFGLLLLALLIAWVAVFKALAGIFGFLGGTFSWPWATAIAADCNTAATDLHIAGDRLASFLPGTTGAKMRAAARHAAAKVIPPVVGLCLLAGLALGTSSCAWFQAHPAVQEDTAACVQCVGQDAITNETSATPLPFFPQFCDKLVSDCGSTCGSDVVAVISALGSSSDPAVAKTGAFKEASARKKVMLSPAPLTLATP
jgi:hypothetical protein